MSADEPRIFVNEEVELTLTNMLGEHYTHKVQVLAYHYSDGTVTFALRQHGHDRWGVPSVALEEVDGIRTSTEPAPVPDQSYAAVLRSYGGCTGCMEGHHGLTKEGRCLCCGHRV